jgi:NAD(P)-dependent dehydrogenase (short-subunit alcohol dehydrogenase family)
MNKHPAKAICNRNAGWAVVLEVAENPNLCPSHRASHLKGKNMKSLKNKNVLVTGAGSGIGRETAVALAKLGARLYLCDVNEVGLQETKRCTGLTDSDVKVFQTDVSSEAEMRHLAERVHKDIEALDVLINNAGVALNGGFLDTKLDDWDWILRINLWGVIYGCHFFVPNMVARRQGGHVVNVSSVAGMVSSPEMTAYSTSKFGVLGMSEAMRDEFAEYGIGVTAICPGIINTKITQTMRVRGKASEQGTRAQISEIYRKRNYGPDQVAQVIIQSILQNKAVVPVSPEAWAMHLLKRLSPRLTPWVMKQVAKMVVNP